VQGPPTKTNKSTPSRENNQPILASSTMTETNHPYMSKSQLNEYLASLRSSQYGRYRGSSESEEERSTPIVRALKERHGEGNTPVPSTPVSPTKGRESYVRKVLPPLPGMKSGNSALWRRSSSKHDRNVYETEEVTDRQPRQEGFVRSESPERRGDFWSTGVPPTIVTSARTQRPLPRDPSDQDRKPAIDDPALSDSGTGNLSSVPSINVPSIDAPSINEPSDGEKPARSWPNINVRSKSSPALHCSVCDGSISGRIVTAIGRRFHAECFRCETCNTELV
jgi:LIM domain